jgi:hypothetical protein
MLLSTKTRMIICSALITMAFALGCHKKGVDTHYVSQFLKDYTVFKPGSYWIYKNETTGKTDSCYIIKFTDIFRQDAGYSTDPYLEFILVSYQSEVLTSMYIDVDQATLSCKFAEGNCLRASNVPPVFEYDKYHKYEFLGSFDTVNVNGVNFADIVNTKYSQNGAGVLPYNNYVLTYYLSKSIGLIKYRQQLDNYDTTWTLLRYHIQH